jgi:polyisoprenoid-binding protein YceI
MRRLLRYALATVALVTAASAAVAAPMRFTVDRPHSEMGFEVRHFFSKVHGRFDDFQGTIVFDASDPSKISVEGTAATASISTDNERRDKHLRSADFFDAENFPALTFKSTKVTANGRDKYKVAGDLTLRGVTKPVVFDAEFLGSGEVPQMGVKAGFTATTVINRKDFGINWNKTLDNGGLMLGDDVTLLISVEGNQVQEEAAAGSK